MANMDIAEVRRRNLRAWIDQDPHSQGNVEAWCHHYSRFADKPISPTYIRQLVPARGGAARNIGERAARKLEAAGGKPPGWLDIAPGTLLVQESAPTPAPGSYAALAAAQGGHEGGTLLTGLSPAPDRKGMVPLISSVQAGHWTHAADLLQPGEAYDWIETGVTVRPHTFALRVTGDSMEPEFAHGTIVIVEPEMDAHPGDYVVAKNGDEEAVLKKLVRDGADLYLVPLNTRYPIKPLGAARIVGVVREAVKRYR